MSSSARVGCSRGGAFCAALPLPAQQAPHDQPLCLPCAALELAYH